MADHGGMSWRQKSDEVMTLSIGLTRMMMMVFARLSDMMEGVGCPLARQRLKAAG